MPQSSKKPLTATDFFRYLTCPHWPYWERFGDPSLRRVRTDVEERLLADGLDHEEKVVKRIYGDFTTVSRSEDQAVDETLRLMRGGAPVIYQAWLKDGDWSGRPDILERHPGKSIFGDWFYVPVDVKRAHELHKTHKAQLTFYAVLLEKIQGVFPAHPAILNGDGERLEFSTDEFLKEFWEITAAIERIRDGERPEPVYRKACVDVSPWGDACFKLANETRDIALLFNVDVNKLKALRNCGIRTIDDAAALDPVALEGREPYLTLKGLQAVQRQAASLCDDSVIIRRAYLVPVRPTALFFDIESYPLQDRDYLYGFWSGTVADGTYQSFLAEHPEDEEQMWKEFLAWLPTIPTETVIYHYGAYEPQRLSVLAKRYGDEENPWLARFVKRLVDVKELVRDHAVFPLYFYSLKTIAKFLGFSWSGDVTSGVGSVDAYHDWLVKNDHAILDEIVRYNRDDVRATAFLVHWMDRFAKTERAFVRPYPWESETV